MRKLMLLTAVLVLAFSASVAFAGSTEDAYFFNNTDEARRVEIRIVCTESGSGAMPTVHVSAHGDAHFNYSGHYSEKQNWTFKVYDPNSKLVAEAIVNWADGKFSPQVVGDGITYETFSPEELKLTITK